LTAFDGEVEAIANLMEFVVDNEFPRNLTIYSDAQAAIALGTQEQALGRSGQFEV
jgi:hypothetical protein